jgi:hypothetical protein
MAEPLCQADFLSPTQDGMAVKRQSLIPKASIECGKTRA